MRNLLFSILTFVLIGAGMLFQSNCFADTQGSPIPVVPNSVTPNIPSWMVGNWKFIGYIYHDEYKLPLNPDLLIIFHFDANGTDTLYWSRKNEPGFCERKGHFTVIDTNYNDEVFWTNPKNNIDCGQDPDMQIGKKTSTEITLVDKQIRLNLGLGGEPFYYVFEQVDDYPGPTKD